METKYFVNLAAAFIPLLVGAIWYNPKVFGSFLRPAEGTNEKKSKGHMPLVFVLAYVCSYFIAGSLRSIVIHQYGLLSMLANHHEVHTAGTELNLTVQGLLDKYGTDFRSFKHGALHGTLTGVFLILPVMAIHTLFESKKWYYLAINAGYWVVCLALMGGIVCAYMPMTYPLVH